MAQTGQRAVLDSPIGSLGLVVTARGLHRVFLPRSSRPERAGPAGARPGEPAAGAGTSRAARQILEYLHGRRREFDLPLDLAGIGEVPRAVLGELCARAPYGKVVTYGQLAGWTGCPGGARAVGQIMATNPIPLVIPCHRVVAAEGLGGFGGGLPLKRWLLRLEGALTEQLTLV